LDKPSGITSANAVARVKHLLPKGTKAGHTGTLDPLASGLLVLLIGRATRLSRYASGLDKDYVATARFGAVSAPLDADGEITPLKGVSILDETTIRAATNHFTGEISQIPPMASAIKVGGERLYKILRRGEIVERERRLTKVYALDLLTFDAQTKTATFRVSCSSGTYVRTLIADLASSLGTGAYLTALRRTQVGHFRVQRALSLEKLSSDTVSNYLIQAKEVVAHLPAVEVDPGHRGAVCSGRKIETSEHGSFRVEVEGELLAVYRGEDGEARAEVVLCVG
jgi:tRNA pseudouridine55 synthase